MGQSPEDTRPSADEATGESPMTATAADSKKVRASWKARALRWLLVPLLFLFLTLLIVWTTLAVYYSNLPWAWLRLVLALDVVAFSAWALYLKCRPWRRL